MPEFIQCPKCDRRLRVVDPLLGKKVKCPQCGAIFTAEVAAPAAEEEFEEQARVQKRRRPAQTPEDEHVEEGSAPSRRPEAEVEEEEFEEEEEERARRRKVRGTLRAWKTVRKGLNFYLASICVMVVAALSPCCGGVAMAGAGGQGGAALAGIVILVLLMILALLAGEGLAITGNVFCLSAPPRHGANKLAMATLVLAGAGLLFSILGALIEVAAGGGAVAQLQPLGPEASPGAGFFRALGALAGLAQYFTFLFFLRATALAVRASHDLLRSIQNLMILSGVTVAAYLGMFLVILVVGIAGHGAVGPGQARAGPGQARAGGFLVGVSACVITILGLIVIVWYILVLMRTRHAITDYLRGRA